MSEKLTHIQGKEGIIKKDSNCQYFFGVEDASLWYKLSYTEALEKRIELANAVITRELAKENMLMNYHKIKRVSDAIQDEEKKLKDIPKHK